MSNEQPETATSSTHQKFMDASLEQGQIALLNKEVPIGCIVTCNNQIIATGHNLTNKHGNPLLHAEVVAIKKLTKDQRKEKLCIYITVEPCIMCMGILQRLDCKIYFGCYNEIFGGITVLNSSSSFTTLCYQKDAVEMLKKFYDQENLGAPQEKRKKKLRKRAEYD